MQLYSAPGIMDLPKDVLELKCDLWPADKYNPLLFANKNAHRRCLKHMLKACRMCVYRVIEEMEEALNPANDLYGDQGLVVVYGDQGLVLARQVIFPLLDARALLRDISRFSIL
jgi:hypothetical protein